MKHLIARAIITLSFAVLLMHAGHAEEPGVMRQVRIEFNQVPLPAALARLQEASGLHLAFSNDLVRDAAPVTLSAKDEPVDSVLLRILRPRGLECIYTGETMAAIVRADSDVGMAKMAGRAIRTLAALARKLDSAKQVGDEIVMPEWMDEDDRALVETIFELDCANKHRWALHLSEGTDESVERLAAMLECFDGDVRLGSAGLAYPMWQADPAGKQGRRIAAALGRMRQDGDPLIRGAAVVVRCTQRGKMRDSLFSMFRDAIEAAAGDEAPEVRFAAAIGCLQYSGIGFADDTLRRLRRDPNVVVRAAAWLAPSYSRYYRLPRKLPELGTALRDASPVVRTICLDHIVCALQDEDEKWRIYSNTMTRSTVMDTDSIIRLLGDDRRRVREVMAAEGVADDPWLTMAAQALLAKSDTVWYLRTNWKSGASGQGSPPSDRPRNEAEALKAIGKLFASGKRSHAIIGCMALMDCWKNVALMANRVAYAPEKAQAGSPHLPTRLMAAAACGPLESADAASPDSRARLLKALGSADPLERMAALWGCSPIWKPSTSTDLHEKVLASLKARSVTERSLAVQVAARALPIDTLLALMKDYGTREPDSSTTRLLLYLMWNRQSLARRPSRQQGQVRLVDTILGTRSASLQKEFIRRTGNSNYTDRNPPLLRVLIVKSEPEAFYALLNSKDVRFQAAAQRWRVAGVPWPPARKWYSLDALKERIAALFRGPSALDLTIDRLAGLIRGKGGKPNLPALAAVPGLL
ncbi:MAG TPA: hypothetical protein VM223_23430 [Planctomycetota bacterium]|nr:hypothetical protein [Planctomycetota bacterium]